MTITLNYPAPKLYPVEKPVRCCIVYGYDKRVKYEDEFKFVPVFRCAREPETYVDGTWYCGIHDPYR